jgi:hypothetical protein
MKEFFISPVSNLATLLFPCFGESSFLFYKMSQDSQSMPEHESFVLKRSVKQAMYRIYIGQTIVPNTRYQYICIPLKSGAIGQFKALYNCKIENAQTSCSVPFDGLEAFLFTFDEIIASTAFPSGTAACTNSAERMLQG